MAQVESFYEFTSCRFESGKVEGKMTNLYHAKNGDLLSVSRRRLANEDQLQAWIAANPRLIGLDVLVLGREVSTEFGGRIDILALDREGNIVVVECKRDSGSNSRTSGFGWAFPLLAAMTRRK